MASDQSLRLAEFRARVPLGDWLVKELSIPHLVNAVLERPHYLMPIWRICLFTLVLDTNKIMKYALFVKLCQHNFTIVIVHKLLVHGHDTQTVQN